MEEYLKTLDSKVADMNAAHEALKEALNATPAEAEEAYAALRNAAAEIVATPHF